MKMIKQFLVFLITIILVGCSVDKTDAEIVQLNDSIAKTNQCKLTAELKTSNNVKTLELTLESAYENTNLPGKILIDYYNAIKSKGHTVNKFIIRNTKSEIYSIQEKEAQKISEIITHSNSVFVNGNLNIEKLYENFGDSLKGQTSLNEFVKTYEEFKTDLSNHTYIGFELFQNLVGVRYVNGKSMIELVYFVDSPKNEIVGFNLQ